MTRHRVFKPRSNPARSNPSGRESGQSGLWLYGLHPVRAALANPARTVLKAVLTPRAAEILGRPLLHRVPHDIADGDMVARLLPPGSVHQGAALLCQPLPHRDLAEVLRAQPQGGRIVALLDQITDPHNEGAILRSAAAFGVSAIVVQDRHAPPESGVLAKAASGALDIVPRVAMVNLARALEDLGEMGFWRIALDGEGDAPISDAASPGDMALVFGAEGAGLRRLVKERCDTTAYIPIGKAMESLNVSNAAAIAFYEMRRARTS